RSSTLSSSVRAACAPARRPSSRACSSSAARAAAADSSARRFASSAASPSARAFATWGAAKSASSALRMPATAAPRRMLFDKTLISLATHHDLTFLGEAAHDAEDLPLLRLDLGQAHRPLRLQVVAQHLGGTLGHVFEDLLAQRLARPLERDDQRLG